MTNFVELVDIWKSYPNLAEPVLQGVNWKFLKGERLVVLGASGSGKTTLLHLLGLLLKADQGQILLEGKDAQLWSEQERAKWRSSNLGYVYQDFGLIRELNLVENVELPLRIAGLEPERKLAVELLGEVGLGGRKSSFPSEISGGEKQRVAIARALIGRPKLVLADEPTGNLQRAQGEDVVLLFSKLQKELGFSLVVATHNQELASVLEANVLELQSGNLVS